MAELKRLIPMPVWIIAAAGLFAVGIGLQAPHWLNPQPAPPPPPQGRVATERDLATTPQGKPIGFAEPSASPETFRETFQENKRTRQVYWASDEVQVIFSRKHIGIKSIDILGFGIKVLEETEDFVTALVEPMDHERFRIWAVEKQKNPAVQEVRPVYYPSALAWKRRSEKERMYLTPRIAVILPEGRDAKAIAAKYGLNLVDAGDMGPRTFLFQAPSPLDTFSIASRIQEAEGATLSTPQFAVRMATRNLPNDPHFNEQWYLQNTGQAGAAPGEDIHAVKAWAQNTKGKGIVIGIIDTAIENSHPDLKPNRNSKLSLVISKEFPTNTRDDHGTTVAGAAVARGDNQIGIVGVAPEASYASIDLIGMETEDNQAARSFRHRNQDIHIKNVSWGPPDANRQGNSNTPPSFKKMTGPLTDEAINFAVTEGRSGKGVVIVWAAGNGGASEDNLNYDGDANRREVIAVGAVGSKGVHAKYSEPGAALLVCAPGGEAANCNDPHGVLTTDRTGISGVSRTDYTYVEGTSYAAPVAAGVVALMLSVRDSLSYRDVMHILVRTARRNDKDHSDWFKNGAGLWINHQYGFGVIDAERAVAEAKTWVATGPERQLEGADKPKGVLAIPDGQGVLERVIRIDGNLKIEHVEVILRATHPRCGDLRVTLISPAGTRSLLVLPRKDDEPFREEWRFMSTLCWGESATGDWKLKIEDTEKENAGSLGEWSLKLYGTEP